MWKCDRNSSDLSNLIWFMFLFHEYMVSMECNGHTLETWSYGDPCSNAFSLERRSLPLAFEELSCYLICAQMTCLSVNHLKSFHATISKTYEQNELYPYSHLKSFSCYQNMDTLGWIGGIYLYIHTLTRIWVREIVERQMNFKDEMELNEYPYCLVSIELIWC